MARTIDGIEISEEFDGIDDDIVMGLMKENGLIGDQQEESEATSTEESTENEAAEQSENDDTESELDRDTEPVKTQDASEDNDTTTDDANTKTVPYQAMIAERNKRKALQAEIAALKAQYGTTPPTQVQPPVTQPPVKEEKTEQTTDQKKAYYDYIKKSALEMFVAEFDREPDGLDTDDMIILGSYAADVKDGIKKYQEEQRQIAEKAQSINQTYRQFVAEQQKRDEYEEIATDFVNQVKALPPEEQSVITLAYQQCEAGKASPQDVYLLKKFWNEIANKHIQPPVAETKQPAKVVAPVKSAKTAEEKLSQIEKHPRTSLVTGTNTTKTTSIDEIAKLMNEMPWPEFEKKYPDYAKILLEG